MRRLPLFFLMLLSLTAEANDLRAVRWHHFRPIRPKDFDPGSVNYPNHSNEDPTVIANYILAELPQVPPVARALNCIRTVLKRNASHEQRAVLIRDCFDAIQAISRPAWNAQDELRGRIVLFYGRFLNKDSRFALAYDLRSGDMYLGKPNCQALLATHEPDLSDETQWRKFNPDLVPDFPSLPQKS